MKKLTYSISILFILSVSALISQPRKMHERMTTLKKVKLLEFLDLEESVANKVIMKIDSYEDQLRDAKEEMREKGRKIYNELDDLSETEVKKQNDELIKLQKRIADIHQERLESMRTILNEQQFAKYQIFELKFAEEIRKHLIEFREKRKRR